MFRFFGAKRSKDADFWYRRIREDYHCCRVQDNQQLLYHHINLEDWVAKNDLRFLNLYNKPDNGGVSNLPSSFDVIKYDVSDRSLLQELYQSGMNSVSQMDSHVVNFREQLLSNFSLEDFLVKRSSNVESWEYVQFNQTG